ncbi:nectarin-1 [Capsicum galapagoense]
MASFTNMFSLIVVIMTLFFINSDKACAADPDMLQDICVADLNSNLLVNGFPCKNVFSAADFASLVLSRPGATNNTFGSAVTAANVLGVPGLNTLGVSMARIDFASGGINPPHLHPRATEMIFVLQGELDVGFFTTANVFVAKRIVQGEVFAFPRGLVHFQKNNGEVTATVISAFNSQLPGTQAIATTLFGSSPPVPNEILAQAFQIDTAQVQQIKSKFAPK